MKQYIKVIPLQGIVYQNKQLNFNDTKEKMEEVLGKNYEKTDFSYYYFDSDLRIDFTKEGIIEFIEFLGGKEGNTQPQIYGVNALEIKADELIAILKEKNNNEVLEEDGGYSYTFSNIAVGIYRSCIPEEVEELIQEAIEDNNALTEEEIQEERDKAIYFATLGIGKKRYYKE